jgi:hypothetical protein
MSETAVTRDRLGIELYVEENAKSKRCRYGVELYQSKPTLSWWYDEKRILQVESAGSSNACRKCVCVC